MDSSLGGPPAGGPLLAGRWRRLFAGLIDLIILSIVQSIFLVRTDLYARWTDLPYVAIDWGQSSGWGGFAVLLGFLYFWLLHAFWNGQTLGKRILGIRVVRAVGGGPISGGQAAGRAAFYEVLPWLCCGVLAIVDLAWILFDGKKQALHDKVASTLVISA